MSEDISPVIDMPEGSQGANYEDGDQAAQVQHSPHSIEPTITNQHTPHTSILINEATPVANNSLAQQNGQGQVDGPSSTTPIYSRKPLVIEKALLTDISEDKQWIASIVERSGANGNKQVYLKMNKLYDDGTGCPKEKDITEFIPTDVRNYLCLLSISSKGKRVAISFLPIRKAKLEEQPQQLERRLEQLKWRLKQLEEQHQELVGVRVLRMQHQLLEEEAQGFERQLQELEGRLQEVERRLQQSEEQLQQSERQPQELEGRLQRLEGRLQRLEGRLQLLEGTALDVAKYLVFQVDGNAEIEPEKDAKVVQGHAVFISDNLLAIINKSEVKVYDSNNAYKLKTRYITYRISIEPTKFDRNKLDWSDTHLLNRSSVNQHQEPERPLNPNLVDAYLWQAEFMKNNVIVSAHDKNIIRVWSLTNGCRLTSFQTRTLEVPLALSSDNRFIATFSKSESLINIYHMKTGLVCNTLRITLGNDLCTKDDLNHQMVYAQFCDKDQLLFLIQVCPWKPNSDTNNALITFEGWDIAAEKPIIKQKENVRVNWEAKNSYVKPFVIEKYEDIHPVYTGVYATLVDHDSCEFRSLDLNVFKRKEPSGGEGTFTYNWMSLSASETLPQDENASFSHATCFKLKENPAVVLRIDKNTAQLWHVSDLTSRNGLCSQNRLIYICAFKAPFYYSNNPFDYSWDRQKFTLISTSFAVGDGFSEPASDTEEGEDANRLQNQAHTGSATRVNNPDAVSQAGSSLIDPIDSWDPFGIVFHDNTLENMLSVSIYENLSEFEKELAALHEFFSKLGIKKDWKQKPQKESSMKIYLPLGVLTSESYNVCTEYHYVESAINALYYIHCMSTDKRNSNPKELYQKTRGLVRRCVDQMKKEKSNYFTTIPGSNSLALLASFKDGRDILFQIVQDEEIAISLFSFVYEGAQTDYAFKKENRHENALTKLIENRDFALYNLVLNRVLFHAQKLGVGCYSAVADLLFYLQDRGDTDILKSTCQKLQFLQVEESVQSIVDGEISNAVPSKILYKNLKVEFTDLRPESTDEQILKFDNCLKGKLIYFWFLCGKFWRIFYIIQRRVRRWYAYHKNSTFGGFLHSITNGAANPNLINICAIPYVYFCSYDVCKGDKESAPNHRNRDDNSFWWDLLISLDKWAERHELENTVDSLFDQQGNRLYILFQTILRKLVAKLLQPRKFNYKKESLLIHLALNQHENDLFSQKDTIMETLLYFKWKKQIRARFLIICFVHAVYYVSFSVGVLFANEVFDYTIGTTIAGNFKHILTIALMLASCGILWVQEIRQFFKMGLKCWKYFLSFYNYVDLAALILPIINLWQMLTDGPGLNELSAITTIVLWLHGVLRLRAVASFGVTVETIIQLMKSVYKTLFIMLLAIFAFTNAFIVLLAHKEDAYFQEKYSGSMVSNNSDSPTENTVNYNDDSSSNNFRNPVKAFSALWFFIYGVWDPINDGDAGDDYMIMALAILYSLLTVLLFFNLVVALMSSRAEEVKALGKSVWLHHFAVVIAEVEQLWCFKFERVSRDNNPSFLYYYAKKTDIRRQADMLEEESNELVQKLQSRIEKRERIKNQFLD